MLQASFGDGFEAVGEADFYLTLLQLARTPPQDMPELSGRLYQARTALSLWQKGIADVHTKAERWFVVKKSPCHDQRACHHGHSIKKRQQHRSGLHKPAEAKLRLHEASWFTSGC